jgi:hypothetical protein
MLQITSLRNYSGPKTALRKILRKWLEEPKKEKKKKQRRS